MNKKISDKDKKDWEEFLSKNVKLSDKDLNFETKKIFKSRSIDLHGHSLDEANIKIKNFIEKAYDDGVEKLVIITGKGIHSTNENDSYVSKDFGKLKFSVPEYLKSDLELNKLIISINKAVIKDGGEGAILIKLKNL